MSEFLKAVDSEIARLRAEASHISIRLSTVQQLRDLYVSLEAGGSSAGLVVASPVAAPDAAPAVDTSPDPVDAAPAVPELWDPDPAPSGVASQPLASPGDTATRLDPLPSAQATSEHRAPAPPEAPTKLVKHSIGFGPGSEPAPPLAEAVAEIAPRRTTASVGRRCADCSAPLSSQTRGDLCRLHAGQQRAASMRAAKERKRQAAEVRLSLQPSTPESPRDAPLPASEPTPSAASAALAEDLRPAVPSLALVTEAIRQVRRADVPVLREPHHEDAGPRWAGGKATEADLRAMIAAHLNQLGHVAPWSPARDLALVQGIVVNGKVEAGAAAAGVDKEAARLRWEALTAPIRGTIYRRQADHRVRQSRAVDLRGQDALGAELRRRAERALEAAE